MTTNRMFKLAKRPMGMVKREDFEFAQAPAGEPGPGEVLVKILYLSLDPAMRGWMNDGKSYVPPVGIGEVMHLPAAVARRFDVGEAVVDEQHCARGIAKAPGGERANHLRRRQIGDRIESCNRYRG